MASSSTGITSVSHPATGYYCILPSSTTLRTDVEDGTVGVQLTQSSTTGTAIGVFVVQLTGSNVTKHCSSDEIAVTVVRLVNLNSSIVGGGTSSAPSGTYEGYESTNSDFTVLFD